MRKTYRYTILTLFLALVFAFGSMMGMNVILRAKERSLLSESGRAVVETPVRAWQKQESGEEGEGEEVSGREKYSLTTGQIEEVIRRWDEKMVVTFHNPVNGQISMEEAINAGEDWLVQMGIRKDIQGEGAEACSVSATLGIARQTESFEMQSEPYYSFWYVRFTSSSMMAFLYVNAVNGKVWSADITFYENMPQEMPYEKLERFVDLCGLQSENTLIVENQEKEKAFVVIEDSALCAQMEIHHVQTKVVCDGYEPNGLTDYGGIALYQENIVLTFRLALS